MGGGAKGTPSAGNVQGTLHISGYMGDGRKKRKKLKKLRALLTLAKILMRT